MKRGIDMVMKKISTKLKEVDKKVLRIVKKGIIFSGILNIISVILLYTYTAIGNPIFYHTGLSLFESSLFFAVAFIICGFMLYDFL